MPRIRVEYTRKKQVIEKGYVTVDVDGMATLRDVYEKAYDKQFTEKLPQEEEILSEEWDFTVKETQNNDETSSPRPA